MIRAFTVVVMAVMVGCSPPEKPMPSDTAKQNILSINIGANPSFLNPILFTDSTSHAVVRMVFNGLFKQDDDLNMVPDLVQSYTISDDGLVYTFRLHASVTWHDGAPFTADDVVFTFNTLLDPSTNTVRRGHFVINNQPVRFEALDAYTVQATLPQPYAPFLSVLDIGILPKHALKDEAINTTNFNRQPIGTGPFKFVEWKPDQYIRLMRNDAYFKSPAKLNGIIMKIIPDSSTSLVALKRGEIDMSGIPGKDIAAIQQLPWLDFYTYSRLNYSYIGLNLQRKPLNHPLVRQAMTMAINKQTIIDSVLRGYGEPAYIPSSPLSWAYPPLSGINTHSYNPDAARRLLEDAGYVYNLQEKGYEKDGERLAFTLLVAQGSKDGERIAQIVQRFLVAIGIQMDIQIMEWSSLLKTIHSNVSPKPFDAIMLGWGFDINDPDDAYTSWHGSQYPNGGNVNGYLNPNTDALLDKGRVTMNKQQRKAIYAEFYAIISNDAPYIFLFHPKAAVAVHPYVKGLSKPGPAGMLNNIESVYIDTQ